MGLRCEEKGYRVKATHLAAPQPLRFEGQLVEVPGAALQLPEGVLVKVDADADSLALLPAVPRIRRACTSTEVNVRAQTTSIRISNKEAEELELELVIRMQLSCYCCGGSHLQRLDPRSVRFERENLCHLRSHEVA